MMRRSGLLALGLALVAGAVVAQAVLERTVTPIGLTPEAISKRLMEAKLGEPARRVDLLMPAVRLLDTPCPAGQVRVPLQEANARNLTPLTQGSNWACVWPRATVEQSGSCPAGWSGGAYAYQDIVEIQQAGLRLVLVSSTMVGASPCTRVRDETGLQPCPAPWTAQNGTYQTRQAVTERLENPWAPTTLWQVSEVTRGAVVATNTDLCTGGRTDVGYWIESCPEGFTPGTPAQASPQVWLFNQSLWSGAQRRFIGGPQVNLGPKPAIGRMWTAPIEEQLTTDLTTTQMVFKGPWSGLVVDCRAPLACPVEWESSQGVGSNTDWCWHWTHNRECRGVDLYGVPVAEIMNRWTGERVRHPYYLGTVAWSIEANAQACGYIPPTPTCPAGQEWNGNSCVRSCSAGETQDDLGQCCAPTAQMPTYVLPWHTHRLFEGRIQNVCSCNLPPVADMIHRQPDFETQQQYHGRLHGYRSFAGIPLNERTLFDVSDGCSTTNDSGACEGPTFGLIPAQMSRKGYVNYNPNTGEVRCVYNAHDIPQPDGASPAQGQNDGNTGGDNSSDG